MFPGFSDLNTAGSATAGPQGGPAEEMSEQPSKEGSHASTSVRHRKRRRGGKTSWGRGSGRFSGQESLGKALVSFMTWQQSAEERLLSLEEAQLEREWRAEERRGEREERRAEQERRHELQLFGMLTGALFAAGRGAPTSAATDSPVSPSAPHTTAAAPPVSSSSPQTPEDAPTARAVSTQETKKSQPTPAAAGQRSQTLLATLRRAEAPVRSAYLSNRGNSIRQHQGILQEGFIQYAMNKYHHTDNPDVSQQHSVWSN